VSGKLVMPALRNFELVLEHPLDRAAMKDCVEAVDALVAAAADVLADRDYCADQSLNGIIGDKQIRALRDALAKFKEA
jgi:hypothetical protein